MITRTSPPDPEAILRELRDDSDRLDACRRIELCELALQHLSREVKPVLWALAQFELGNSFKDCQAGSRAQNLEHSLASYTAALEVFTSDSQPAAWASIQNNLANVYTRRILGNSAENIENAIACCVAVLALPLLDL